MVLDIFALVVIALLIGVVIWLVVLLGNMPGEIARKRNHPQAEAINILGWIGLLFGGIPWLVALVWAYTKPITAGNLPATGTPLSQASPHAETETR